MSRPLTDEEIANLSDEEIMGMEFAQAVGSEPEAEAQTDEHSEDVAVETAGEEQEVDDANDVDGAGDSGGDDSTEPPVSDPAVEAEEPAPEAQAQEVKAAEAFDYEAAYKKLTAPFKANGREIQVNSPEEMVQLAQMGANYTKKMQALQPNLKLMRMLETNGLLDEAKLSFLIDIDKKDPGAIQKLIADAKIDPMDIDSSKAPDYRPGNHAVNDTEWQFSQVMSEVVETESGRSIVATIDKDWDARSKTELYKDPAALKALTKHKESGIFDRIVDEVERRRLFGQISRTDPFINAYKAVGMEMQQAGLFNPAQATVPAPSVPPVTSPVLETRPAQKKPVVAAAAQVRAASPSRSTPAKTRPSDFNPLSMTDEEFMKSAELGSRY